MKVHDLKPADGSRKRRKRVGRGIGGKGGKTAGRGTKGQKARDTIPVSFEGGQLPMSMRIPKLRGFNNPFRSSTRSSTWTPSRRPGWTEVTPETLRSKGLVSKGALVKVLAGASSPAPSRSRSTPAPPSAEAASPVPVAPWRSCHCPSACVPPSPAAPTPTDEPTGPGPFGQPVRGGLRSPLIQRSI